MICITYWTDWSAITVAAKFLATACLLLAAMYISITIVTPLLVIIAVAAVKTIIVLALTASPMLYIYIQKRVR